MRHPCVDSKEIRIPRNDLIRGRGTGIIITLLPISSETVETTGRKEKMKWPGPSESEMKGSRNREGGTKGGERTDTREREREREKERERTHETKRAFRSRHPVYRSAVRDAGPNGVAFSADNYH